jgi:hypothetical protein
MAFFLSSFLSLLNWDSVIAWRLLIIAVLRFLSPSEDDGLLSLLLLRLLFCFLCLFLLLGVLDLLLDLDLSSESLELLLELELELELGLELGGEPRVPGLLLSGDPFSSSLRIDLVFEDLDLEPPESLAFDLDLDDLDKGDAFEMGDLLAVLLLSLRSFPSFSLEELRFDPLGDGLGPGSLLPVFCFFSSLIPFSPPWSRDFAMSDLSGDLWGGF